MGLVVRRALLATLALAAAAPAMAQTVGFRNDGSGHWAAATPPTAWNEAAGKGIAWKIKLDHWGNGEPIVVKDRLYLVQELDWWNFDRVGPSLICLDLKDGSVIWQRELDHTGALPAEQARQAREDWIKLRKKYYQGWQICTDVAKEHGPGRDALNAAREKLHSHGMTIKNPQTVFNLQVTGREDRALEKRLAASHFWTCDWSQPRGQWCGAGYATPVSDGRRVYVRTGYSAAFCFDLDGTPVWTALFEGGEGKKQSWCVSPVVVDGVLIIADSQNCHGFDAIGLDVATGKRLWTVKPWPSWEGYSLGSCQVLTVDGKHVVHLPSGRIIRPSDGAVLAEGVGRAKWTATTGAGDLLIVPFFKGKLRAAEAKLYPWMPEADSLVAYRLAWDGSDRIAPRRLWVNPVGDRKLEISPVLANGLVFQVVGSSGVAAFDAETGKQVAMRDGREFGRPKNSWHLSVAGGYLYVIDYVTGEVVVLQADRSLKVVVTNPPLGRPAGETPLPYATWTIGAGKPGSRPRLPQTGALTFAGDRLILRAFRYVYCLKER